MDCILWRIWGNWGLTRLNLLRLGIKLTISKCSRILTEALRLGKDLPLTALLILCVWLGVAAGRSADSPSHLWATESADLIFSQCERGIVGLQSEIEWPAFFESSEGKWIGIHLQELNEIKEWLDLPWAVTFIDSYAGYRIISWHSMRPVWLMTRTTCLSSGIVAKFALFKEMKFETVHFLLHSHLP